MPFVAELQIKKCLVRYSLKYNNDSLKKKSSGIRLVRDNYLHLIIITYSSLFSRLVRDNYHTSTSYYNNLQFIIFKTVQIYMYGYTVYCKF